MSVSRFMDNVDQLKEATIKTAEFRGETFDYVLFEKNGARYYIFEAVDDDITTKILSGYEVFSEFQKNFIEEDFEKADINLRFNLCMLFIVTERAKDEYREISTDFSFARKIFLEETDVKDYFDCDYLLCDTNGRNEDKVFGYIDDIKVLRKSLDSILSNTILDTTIDESRSIYKGYQLNCEQCKEMEYCKRKELFVKSLESLKIETYKSFREVEEVSFGKVNLISGDNGTGKTTMLEAIEDYFTTDKDERERHNKYISGKFRCASSAVRELDESDVGCYAKAWYRADRNEMRRSFNHYNYFNIATANKFAVSKRKLTDYVFINELGFDYASFLKIDVKKLAQKKKDLNVLDRYLKQSDDKTGMQEIKEKIKELLQETRDLVSSVEESLKKLKKIKLSLPDILGKVNKIYHFLTLSNGFKEIKIEQNEVCFVMGQSNRCLSADTLSTAESTCLALASLCSAHILNTKAPRFILFDEPLANLDSRHLFNVIDFFKALAISGVQVFFTTADKKTAKIFEKRFSFLGNEFKRFDLERVGELTRIKQ